MVTEDPQRPRCMPSMTRHRPSTPQPSREDHPPTRARSALPLGFPIVVWEFSRPSSSRNLYETSIPPPYLPHISGACQYCHASSMPAPRPASMCHHARLGMLRTRRVAYPARPCRRPPDWSSPALPLRRRAHCHRALPDARVPQVSSHATAIRRAGAGPSCCTHRSVLAALRRPCLSCPPASMADTRPRSGPSRTPSQYCISMD